MQKVIYFCLFVFSLCACKESERSRITRLVKEWEGKEIILPEEIVFTRFGVDTLDYQFPDAEWKVVSYIDSTGCTSCKLQFYRWKQIMYEMDSIVGTPIPFLFVFHPKKRELLKLNVLMKRDRFNYPVWIDQEDKFNRMNKLPDDNMFHSFLLNRQNEIVAIGNPLQNSQMRDLYLKIMSNQVIPSTQPSSINTTISLSKSVIDLGEFDWTEPQKVIFTLKNDGENRLVINDIVSSCGCLSIDYLRLPIEPGKDVSITVTYKAEKPEYINKALTIYANIKSPLKLSIKGSAH